MPVVLLVSGALVLGAWAPVSAARTGPTMPAVAKKHKKKRQVRCRKSQVPIKVNRRTAGCRSLRAALPPARAGDTRLLLAALALDDGLRGLRDRRGRRAPSLKGLIRKAGPRAYRTLQRELARGLTRLDGLGAASARRTGFWAAGNLPACGATAPPTGRDSYDSRDGGVRVTATLSLGAAASLDLQLTGGEYRIHVRTTSDECSHFESPACPDAAGVVDATDRSNDKILVEVARGDTVLTSKSFEFAGRTRMHAEVGNAAKLDLIDIDDTQTANIELGGSQQQFGPVNLLYTGIHHARVDMPSGAYVPDQSAVDIAVTVRGVTFGKSDLGPAAGTIAGDLDKKFAALVKTEIDNFTRLETAWNKPNECVKVEFTPAAKKLILARGGRGSFTAQAVALQGGGLADGRWTRTAQRNATFTPDQAEGSRPQFSYEVTDAGENVVVSATFRVTSRAGVGEGTWEQDTSDAVLYRGTVNGTRGIAQAGNCGVVMQFDYSARLAASGADTPFPILRKEPNTGMELGGAQGYDEAGSGTYTMESCNGLPGCSTNLYLDPAAAYHVLVLFGVNADSVTVTVNAGDVGHGDCGNGSYLGLGTGGFPRSRIGDDTITVDLSFDYAPAYGNGTLTLTRVN